MQTQCSNMPKESTGQGTTLLTVAGPVSVLLQIFKLKVHKRSLRRIHWIVSGNEGDVWTVAVVVET